MEQIEIKEYELRFIIDKDVRLRVGSNVALENRPPLSADDFYWIDSIIHEPFGVMYRVYGIDKTFHAFELYPLLPVLVSDDVLEYNDKFYHDGIIHECVGLNLDDELNMWVVSNVDEEKFIEMEVMKVIASPGCLVGYIMRVLHMTIILFGVILVIWRIILSGVLLFR